MHIASTARSYSKGLLVLVQRSSSSRKSAMASII